MLYDHLEKTWCVIICWIPDTTRAIVLSGKDHLEKWSYYYVSKSHITRAQTARKGTLLVHS